MFRIRSSRPWLWFAVLFALAAAPDAVKAQPPSPLELARGLREHGHVDLALEYLKDLENKPLSPEDKAAILLERAKCLLEASEDEPDEGTRQGMVSEAKEGLSTFLSDHSTHPRAVEALLTQAKLTSVDAKEQLNRARRMEIPGKGEDGREPNAKKQKDEAAKARPLFGLAAKRFGDASEKLRVRLDDKALDPLVRKALEREAFEAELASGINLFNIAETYMPDDAITPAEKEDRNKYLVQAKDVFNKLGKGSISNRTTWVARAWAAEVTYEQDDRNAAADEVGKIMTATAFEAEDGKRLARFFQLRRDYGAALGSRDSVQINKSIDNLKKWLDSYGNARKPTPEYYAVKYFQARSLQMLGEMSLIPKDPKAPPLPVGPAARAQFAEAEKIYRALAQADHDFTARANRNRMAVVRRLLGDAEAPAASYDSFEKAQMASLIQLSKLVQAESKEAALLADPKTSEDKAKLDPVRAEIKDRRAKTIALLERARELAKPTDHSADVTDVLLRLIYFYGVTEQFQRAAELGDQVAHTIKNTGGKAALAGLLGINSYVNAAANVNIDDVDKAAEARKAYRERAMTLARFVDEKYPNDNATDSARYRLAVMLKDEARYADAFAVLIKVRPSFAQISDVRLLEGYVAAQLISAKLDPPLPQEKKTEVFKRALADLARVPKPVSVALEDECKKYLAARCRLALLMFAQKFADPKGEEASPGYVQAIAICEEVIASVPGFDHLNVVEGGVKKPNLTGLEMTMLARDTLTRATYLRAHALIVAGKLADAEKLITPTLDAVRTTGTVFTAEMKGWAGEGEQKTRIADLAAKIDKTRVDVIVAGFRLKVQQGKAAESAGVLDLIIKAGGTIQDNLPILEPLGRELAAKMTVAKKEGKTQEADDFKAGLKELLKKIDSVKDLPPQSVLFIGQTLQTVGENQAAIDRLKQVKPPDFADWDKKKLEEIPQELRGKVRDQIRDYSVAQLTIARALKELKKFDEAEKMLTTIIGTNDKPGWGSGRLYFRKELASMYEEKGASLAADAKAATAEWGKAKQVWETLLGIQRNQLAKQPPLPDKATQDEIKAHKDEGKRLKNNFADAYFDVQRYQVKVYQQLIKDPMKLQTNFETVAKRCVDMEKQIATADWQPEVQHRYVDLMKEFPPLMDAYKKAGGKLFLEKVAANP